ncbi:quinone oxidoreductase family protein [Aureimonas phyllosphaerae]|uniref:NADPH2:quinone reductase n=1 Tax=Aureimonas phyllosphaerae TaxID=1166078 RepID=A0A7W6BQ63_9HYPH|nr:quinone oxidoreductase [Aureimonas phyllosphaerae]MBB3934882.1 NADPH2:quinone reductase [Aureimonas phyllosphaerae]MBB3957903.1 NADPH2:quinone reductase [Aureimonas phyllosphaerae]SFF44391.1 NADPH2:quinone reductase [Aureimonas phyllosphaerae]
MTHAMVIDATGGPEVMQWREQDLAPPGPGELRVRQSAAGLNFIDVYFRNGTYKAPSFPFVPGKEGAGTVVSVGRDVTGFAEGDRVAYAGASGTYAEEINVAATGAVRIPEGISDEVAAGIMLKGMTAEYLLRRTFPVGPGHTILIHAAAGGVGLIAGQWAKHLGATVIGTAGSDDKVRLALDHGYDHVVNYRTENFVERVADITNGAKCDVVYDSVGRDTYPASLDCLKRRGLFVSFGQSSGTIENFDLALLNQKGSLYVTRPSLFGYTATRAELEESANALFDVVRSGAVRVRIDQRYPVSEAARAHRDLEGRRTTGISILTMR